MKTNNPPDHDPADDDTTILLVLLPRFIQYLVGALVELDALFEFRKKPEPITEIPVVLNTVFAGANKGGGNVLGKANSKPVMLDPGTEYIKLK